MATVELEPATVQQDHMIRKPFGGRKDPGKGDSSLTPVVWSSGYDLCQTIFMNFMKFYEVL